LSREDLNLVLEKKQKNKKFGQFLVDENYVSPHAINIVLKEQLVWRMKRLIADSNMEINFVRSDDVSPIAEISDYDFRQFIVDTLEQTVRPDWLKAHYLPFMNNNIEIAQERKQDFRSFRMIPFIARNYPSIEPQMKRGCSLEELLANNPSIEPNVLRLIHLFNVLGFIHFDSAHKAMNFAHQAKRLQKLDKELAEKNYFERLGVSRSAKEGDVKRAYFDLAKVLHPDKLAANTPDNVRELSEKVFEKIQLAYDTP
jgi:hypothetical protein